MSGTHGGLPWYRHYPADFLDGVKALDPEQRGNYITVLDLIYQFGGRIADSARWIAGQCNCSVTAWNRCRTFLIEVGKLVARDGWLTNPRADRELAREAAFQEAKRASGRAGGQRSGETRRNRQADVNRENNPQESNEINTLFPSDPSPPEDVAPVENITVPEPVVTPESAKIVQLFSHIPASTNELDQTVSRSRDSIASDKTLVQADSSTERGRSLTQLPRARAPARVAAAADQQPIVDAWNEMAVATGLPPVKVMTPARRKQLGARLAEHGVDGMLEVIQAVAASDFCRGNSRSGWKADFDFVLQAKSAASAREGKYANGYRRPKGEISRFEEIRRALGTESLLKVQFDDEPPTLEGRLS